MNDFPVITYVNHSCYVAETENAILVFDYYNGKLPSFDSGRDVFVFSSHMHPDHFNPEIFRIFENCGNVTFVLSSDIKLRPAFRRKYGITEEDLRKAVFIGSEEEKHTGSIFVKTVNSTDRGCAFLVKADGKSFFHAGDLNIWVFEGDDEETAVRMKNDFIRETDRIAGIRIDAAFIPVDPRLGSGAQALAAESCLERLDIDRLYPMHMFGDYSLVPDFVAYMREKGLMEHIVIPAQMR